MPDFTVYALGQSQISVSGGEALSGLDQGGDGRHLLGETITLNSNDWEAVSITDNDSSFRDNGGNNQTLNGAQSFDGENYADGLRVEAEYLLVLEDPDGNTYEVLGFNINQPGSGAAFRTVEGLAFVGGVGGFPPIDVPLTVIGAQEGPSRPYASLATPPCFTPGALIQTPNGLIRVEDLCVGQMIDTMDNGPQPIRWIGKTRLPKAVVQRDIRFHPVRISRDAFGAGHPFEEMRLSQQHRILISDWRAELLFGDTEILVPVKKLTNDQSVVVEAPQSDVTYLHILFDRHQVIWANGLPSESFFPDATHSCATSLEILRLFPQLGSTDSAQNAVRPCIQDRRALVLRADTKSGF